MTNDIGMTTDESVDANVPPSAEHYTAAAALFEAQTNEASGESTIADSDGADAPMESAAKREAARYRTRLREAEAKLEAVDQQLMQYQRREAERIAGGRFSNPEDLWLDGAKAADLLDDDGFVNPAKVEAIADAVGDRRPGLKRVRFPDLGGGNRGAAPAGGADWSKVLRGN